MPSSNEQLKKIPVPTLRRMPLYLNLLNEMKAKGEPNASCTILANQLDFLPIQVRKDLAWCGVKGRPKTGYPLRQLVTALEKLLGWDNCADAFLIGAGNLGTALAGYDQFRQSGLNIVAAFDTDPQRIGTQINKVEVLPLEKATDLVKRMRVKIAVLTIPPDEAQRIAQSLVDAGVRAIWNFTPTTLRLDDSVVVENVRLTSSLSVLTSKLREELGK